MEATVLAKISLERFEFESKVFFGTHRLSPCSEMQGWVGREDHWMRVEHLVRLMVLALLL